MNCFYVRCGKYKLFRLRLHHEQPGGHPEDPPPGTSARNVLMVLKCSKVIFMHFIMISLVIFKRILAQSKEHQEGHTEQPYPLMM